MIDEDRVKTSLSVTPSIVLTRQLTLDGTEENPFRDGGEISRDADVIIDAYRQGKLSVLSNPPPTSELEHALSSPGTNSPGSDMPTYPDLPDSVARDRKNGTFSKEKPGLVQLEHSTIQTGKPCDIEKITIPGKQKKCSCCLIL
ncbi:uncharacterized protein LOC111712786 [Eurytemora carolleeae]|uniref:uncharacterized protein LOC111712786 n=1 Tax=Eurytemora carolleeae TaxID=1294199 RepID=UPI000C787FCC|nr:uncharacterized protein LOC111712786 [Eurytemora carolleeae]|eukprot:XP_023343278.1 uncharacterized protein LOC111712786 [Eurytemora affinis]